MHVSDDFEGLAPEGFETTPASDEPFVHMFRLLDNEQTVNLKVEGPTGCIPSELLSLSLR